MRVTLNASQTDARRGVVRLNPLLLDALGVGAWDALELRGKKTTGALAAAAPPGVDQGTILMDDITCMNAGVGGGEVVEVRKGAVLPAARVTLTGIPQGAVPINPEAVRFALLGKVLFPGDKVSLLPQDFSRPGASDDLAEVDAIVKLLRTAWGEGWKTAILDVA
ncbi:MAG: ATPase, partial [Actinomycetota bacterium]|nr:ATPase [Actinomycetota bacterium]